MVAAFPPSRSFTFLKCYTAKHYYSRATSRRTTRKRINTREAASTGNLSAIDINRNTSRTKEGWHAACQFVAGDPQPRELGQETKFGWILTSQFVVGERQTHEFSQVNRPSLDGREPVNSLSGISNHVSCWVIRGPSSDGSEPVSSLT